MNNGFQPALVLDSFAVMAYLQGEPGAMPMIAMLEAAQQEQLRLLFPLINLGEVSYIFEREHGLSLAEQALAVVDQLPIRILDATRQRVLAAAHIKAHYAISYADAFVVAAALEFDAAVLTGDPEFKRVTQLVHLEWLP